LLRGNTDTAQTSKLLDLENPCLVQQLWYLPSFSQFCVQKTSVGCHGNKGQSETNLDDAIELPDPENPHFGANILLLSLKMPELLLFEVAIGLNANFQILGEKRG